MHTPRHYLIGKRCAGVLGAVLLTLVPAVFARPVSASSPVDANGPSGMNLDAALQLTNGDPHTLIAYVEGGVNWHLSAASRLVDHVYVNWHEVPVPCPAASCATVYGAREADYDANGDRVVNAADWGHDPRVPDANGNGYIDPEDLVVAFSDGVDHDGNGFPNDIYGWSFFEDDNDPATADATYGHSDGEMLNALSRCPRCMVLPIRAGQEALDPTEDLAQAWLYAASMGVAVIDSVTADLGYSSFMRRAIERIHRQGIAMVESSNDFDSSDHQGGMFWPDVVPGNGVVATADGTAWTRSDVTSWGPHNVLSVAGEDSTSSSTAVLGGLFGLLLSYGQRAAPPLTGAEAVQVLRAAARPVTDPGLPWPGAPGDWNEQYGYGIPDMKAAMDAAADGDIPPVPTITSPVWYALVDPARTSDLEVTGSIEAPRSSSFSWTLKAGLGPQPSDADLFEIGHGQGAGSFEGAVGTLDLSRVPRSFWSAPFGLSQTKAVETADQYAVTLRLEVTDAEGHVGIDRRVVNVHNDPTWLPGFPVRLGTSGESQPALVDLQGTGRLAMVFGTADGLVHALDPASGKELPGWPARTDALPVRIGVSGTGEVLEPIVADVAVGDFRGTGDLSVVVTSVAGKVYAFDARGNREPGWPHAVGESLGPAAVPRPALPYTRLPVRAAAAAPVLADLRGTGELDVIQAAWDGRIHAWAPSGDDLPGWPVPVRMPAGFTPPAGHVLVNDSLLIGTPVVAHIEGRDRPPDVVERSQFTVLDPSSYTGSPSGFAFAYRPDGSAVPGWPVQLPGFAELYGGAMQFISEGDDSPVAADVDGSGADEVATGPVFSGAYLIDGSGHVRGTFGSVGSRGSPGAVTTSGAFGRLDGTLRFVEPETDLLSLLSALGASNSGRAITELEAAYPAGGGEPLSGFPAPHQGLDFLGASLVVDVDGHGGPDIVDGGDSSALQAYSASGTQADGFPKFTTGWTVWSPSAGDVDSDGTTDIVTVTREGYLFAWSTQGRADGNAEWWRWHHDERNSGLYGIETRPPGSVRDLRWAPGDTTASFVAPGDVWYSGTPVAYLVTLDPQHRSQRIDATVPAGSRQSITIPAGTERITLQAVGRAGLLGSPACVGTTSPPGRTCSQPAASSPSPTPGASSPSGGATPSPTARVLAGRVANLPATGAEAGRDVLLALALLAAGLLLMTLGRRASHIRPGLLR